jgi:CRP/FNR family transcriptional regulator, nitrogen fixation regulation protein
MIRKSGHRFSEKIMLNQNLTLETVSRALSCLHAKGLLDFLGQTQRQIVLRNRTELAKIDL